MVNSTANNSDQDNQQNLTDIGALVERLSADKFRKWYRERQWRRNIKNGQPYLNGQGRVPAPERHSPSQLLQCHRKLLYRQENAPAEQPDPHGIFWFGMRFEKDVLFPFLEQVVTGEQTYVQNSIWIDFTVETEAGELRFKGSTDPVIVTADAKPVLLTEIKTKSSTDDITEPDPHHRAQVHVYLAGLSEKFDKELSDAVLVYGGREAFGLKTFHVEFDADFWNDVVLDWASTHTQFRVDDDLPPANPEYDWECSFCSYRVRCGKGDTAHRDYGTNGLLPGFDGYPRERVVKYLEGNPDESLTPSLAMKYPELVKDYDVTNWYCQTCSSEVDWNEVDPNGNPVCPRCAERNEVSTLSLSREQP